MVTSGTLGLSGKSPRSFHRVARISERRLIHADASRGMAHSGVCTELSQFSGPGSEIGALTVVGAAPMQAAMDKNNACFIGDAGNTGSAPATYIVNGGLVGALPHCRQLRQSVSIHAPS